MRFGISILFVGISVTLTCCVGSTTVAAPPGPLQETASSPSRRLPHRPRLSIPSHGLDASRRTNGSFGSAEAASDSAQIAQASYTVGEGTAAAGAVGKSIVVNPSFEQPGSEAELLWEPADPEVVLQGAEECCPPARGGFHGFALDHLSIYGGVQASKNNSTRGNDASFGFQEGLNFGTAARNLILPPSVGLQVGFQANQANLEGASFTPDDRKQYFMTAGIYRRGDFGLQGGLVFDYLWDKWNYDLQVGQVRGELSMALSERQSYGFLFASPTADDTVVANVSGQSVTETWETVDYYALFYRTALFAGGQGEAFLMAGLSGDSDGIIGGKSRLPLLNGWALETEFTYLVPNESPSQNANAHESWNMGINFVWYPGSVACGECFRYHRPLFDVANNGSLILRQAP